MNGLLEDGLVAIFIVALMLIFANIWAVKSDQQAEAEHQQVIQWKMENQGERHAN